MSDAVGIDWASGPDVTGIAVRRPCDDCGGTGLRPLEAGEPIPDDPADASCPSCEDGYHYTTLTVLKGGADDR